MAHMLSTTTTALGTMMGSWRPSMFILVFYYGRDWKQKVKWFVAVNVVTLLSIETAIFLNSRFHFMEYDWTWWSMLYLLGFMLALPVLSLYNGEKGSDRPGSKFFYIFYPAHLWLAVILRLVLK